MPLDKADIKHNKEYFSFYMELSGTGNSIVNCTGVFKVTLKSKDKFGYGSWMIGDGFTGSSTMSFNIKNRLNGIYPPNGIECKFYDTREEAIKDYNEQIDVFTFKEDTPKQKEAKQKKKL